jgi:hypothetical protein
MSDVAAPRGTLRPPSERPAGRRGPRGWIAAVAALAGLCPMSFVLNAGDTDWARAALVASAAALIGGALLLWTTRRRPVVALALALAVAGGAGTVIAMTAESRAENERSHRVYHLGGAVFDEPVARGPRLTRAEARAVPTGLTRKQLRARLGPPASYGVQRVNDGRDMRCWAYRSESRGARGVLHVFCFRHGRYAERTTW